MFININTNRIQTSCELSKLINIERFHGDEYFYNQFNQQCEDLNIRKQLLKTHDLKLLKTMILKLMLKV